MVMTSYFNLREKIQDNPPVYRVEQLSFDHEWFTQTLQSEAWKIVLAAAQGKEATAFNNIVEVFGSLVEHAAGLQRERDAILGSLVEERSMSVVQIPPCLAGTEQGRQIYRCLLGDRHTAKNHIATSHGSLHVWPVE